MNRFNFFKEIEGVVVKDYAENEIVCFCVGTDKNINYEEVTDIIYNEEEKSIDVYFKKGNVNTYFDIKTIYWRKINE